MKVDPVRSRTMRAVKSKNTSPELVVRKLIHAMGYRFRLHRKDLPGTPDLVFPGRKMALFVNGCFWHGHDCQRGARIPKNNVEYWTKKIERNRARDKETLISLQKLGWRVHVVWECELKDHERLQADIQALMEE
ncbi:MULTISPECIES: very short patch repair endonuclease [Acetobacteraceae]|uniref:Very short patch repair endonuclease n=2 Tax=Acetobacteraceae TaxID=433 RepID=A0A318Q753_9PROT|nr:very short patch repair endonuclease [Novacetimonas pomaceti]GAN87812.1 patch repair protein [Komagataeibacter intermedius TF2]